MKSLTQPLATCLILGCISGVTLAQTNQDTPAQQDQVQSVDRAPMPNEQSTGAADSSLSTLPEQLNQNGVSYLTGGVGQDEARAVKQAAKDYDLMLTFATRRTGAYLADVNVDIMDASGKTVLSTVSDGPMLLAPHCRREPTR